MRLVLLVLASMTLAACDLHGDAVPCADSCGRVFDSAPCEGAGAVLRICQPVLEVTYEAVRCDGTRSCVQFSFTTGEAIRLDQVAVRSPGGGSATFPAGGAGFDPGADHPLQVEGTAYPFEEGRWFFTFVGEHVPEYVEPRFEIEVSDFVSG